MEKNYPLNFDIMDIIDDTYYEKQRTTAEIKYRRIIDERQISEMD